MSENPAYYAIAETHDWYMVVKQNGELQTLDDTRSFSYTEYPNDYVYRLTNAITAYRSGLTFYYKQLNAYRVIALIPSSIIDVCELDISVPLTRDDLYRYSQQ